MIAWSGDCSSANEAKEVKKKGAKEVKKKGAKEGKKKGAKEAMKKPAKASQDEEGAHALFSTFLWHRLTSAHTCLVNRLSGITRGRLVRPRGPWANC